MGVSIWQVLIVLAIVLIIFGPKRIPGLGKSLGQAIRGFKKGSSEDEIDVTKSSESEQISENIQDANATSTTEKSEVKQTNNN